MYASSAVKDPTLDDRAASNGHSWLGSNDEEQTNRSNKWHIGCYSRSRSAKSENRYHECRRIAKTFSFEKYFVLEKFCSFRHVLIQILMFAFFLSIVSDEGNGYSNDACYNGLSERTSSLPSIFPSGNQLIQDDFNNGDSAGGGTGTRTATGGRNGGGRKKVRFRKSKLKQLYDVEVLPVEYLGPKIEYR